MPTQRTNTGRSSKYVDDSGVNGQYAQAAEVVYSAIASSTYATSSFRYIPIAKVVAPNEQYVQIQFRATRSGRLKLKISYAMSVSNAGDVLIQQYQTAVADAASVDAALTTGALTTLTPGTGATRKTLTLNTAFDVVEGSDIIMRLTRDDGAGDTHTGSMNFLNILAYVE